MFSLDRDYGESQIKNLNRYEQMLRSTIQAPEVNVRGFNIREQINYSIEIDPVYPFLDFEERELKIPYFAKEMIWKLGADPYDDSIKSHAKMWESVQNTNGSFNSNYGQYWFGEQMGLFKAFNELVKDKTTRRSCIPMLNTSHIGPNVNDTVCTGHITFLIRESQYSVLDSMNDRLIMLISMRSSDQIFGLGTDVPTFATLYRIIYGMLLTVYPMLKIGNMIVTADSSHIYERHYGLVKRILNNPKPANKTYLPFCDTPAEAFKLAACAGKLQNWGSLSEFLIDQSNRS